MALGLRVLDFGWGHRSCFALAKFLFPEVYEASSTLALTDVWFLCVALGRFM